MRQKPLKGPQVQVVPSDDINVVGRKVEIGIRVRERIFKQLIENESSGRENKINRILWKGKHLVSIKLSTWRCPMRFQELKERIHRPIAWSCRNSTPCFGSWQVQAFHYNNGVLKHKQNLKDPHLRARKEGVGGRRVLSKAGQEGQEHSPIDVTCCSGPVNTFVTSGRRRRNTV